MGKRSTITTCTLEGCNQPFSAKGMCRQHYRKEKFGSTPYYVWTGMKSRCSDKNNKDYPNYGGRGITVCDRWKNSFENFYKDMGDKPSTNHSIDRIDNSGNYEPGNCHWIPLKDQNLNKRSNRIINYNGKTQILKVHCQELKLEYSFILNRLTHGWSVERAFNEPKHHKRVI